MPLIMSFLIANDDFKEVRLGWGRQSTAQTLTTLPSRQPSEGERMNRPIYADGETEAQKASVDSPNAKKPIAEPGGKPRNFSFPALLPAL